VLTSNEMPQCTAQELLRLEQSLWWLSIRVEWDGLDTWNAKKQCLSDQVWTTMAVGGTTTLNQRNALQKSTTIRHYKRQWKEKYTNEQCTNKMQKQMQAVTRNRSSASGALSVTGTFYMGTCTILYTRQWRSTVTHLACNVSCHGKSSPYNFNDPT